MTNRRRRRRYRLPRKTRLILFIATMVILILAVILIVRAVTGRDTATPVSAPAPTESVVAATAIPDGDVAAPDVPDAPSDDDGSAKDDALVGIGDEQVDLAGDLAAAPVREVATGTDRVAVIRSIGDIIIHKPLLKTAYDAATKSYDFSAYFTYARGVMGNADYTVANVEGPLGGTKYASYRAYPQFNTPPHILTALKDAGVDMLTLSNNHALDTYFDGLVGTIKNVDKVGLDHIGTYATQADHDAPYIVSVNNIKIGFLNYTVATNNMLQRSDPAAAEYGIRTTGTSNAPEDIARLRAAGAEAVVVYMHWGEEYERTVTSSLKSMAQKLAGAGADVIVGGHPHVVLPCEWVRATDKNGQQRSALVLYSMGNFLSDQRSRYRDSGVVFEFTLRENEQGLIEATAPRYIPVYVHRYEAPTGYDYRVYACAEVLEDPPRDLPEDVLNRVKQVWNEQKALMADGPATVLAN